MIWSFNIKLNSVLTAMLSIRGEEMLTAFNQLMDYIEAHLTEELSVSTVTKLTGVSAYHFKRTFALIAGMPISTYIKYRRLAAANVDLLAGMAVTTVAFKYGYQTVEGFSRAFKSWSGYQPSMIKHNRIQKTFQKFSFYIDIHGGQSMEFKLITKPAFNLVGVTATAPIQFEGVNPKIQALAESITDQQRQELHTLTDLEPHQVLNASFNFEGERLTEKGTLTQLIGMATKRGNQFSDLTQIAVPEHTWAIFPNKGPFPTTLQATWSRIYSEWLPDSGYEVVEAPEISFTKYGDAEPYSEIWIAVQKKV